MLLPPSITALGKKSGCVGHPLVVLWCGIGRKEIKSNFKFGGTLFDGDNEAVVVVKLKATPLFITSCYLMGVNYT